MLLALDNDEFRILQIFSQSVKQMSEGELLQMEKTRKLDIEEDTYFEIIKAKTASLIAAACGTGAYSVTRDEAVLEKMWKFGELVGTAYQIKDDIFDYGSSKIGKPTGIDIKEKKMTLPLIHVLSNSSQSDKRWIIRTVKKDNLNPEKVNKVIKYVHDNGGIAYAKKKMNQIVEEAIGILSDIPDSEAKTSLIQLIDFVIEREN